MDSRVPRYVDIDVDVTVTVTMIVTMSMSMSMNIECCGCFSSGWKIVTLDAEPMEAGEILNSSNYMQCRSRVDES